MIGATWDLAKLGHARRGIFPVEWQLPEHPVCRGLATSFEANDELYHRLTLAPGVQVLASAMMTGLKASTSVSSSSAAFGASIT